MYVFLNFFHFLEELYLKSESNHLILLNELNIYLCINEEKLVKNNYYSKYQFFVRLNFTILYIYIFFFRQFNYVIFYYLRAGYRSRLPAGNIFFLAMSCGVNIFLSLIYI